MKTTLTSPASLLEKNSALQLDRLRSFLKTRVLPFSPFYRRVFAEIGLEAAALRTMDDWARVPFTAKEDLAAGPKDFVLQPDPVVLKRQPSVVLRALTQGRHAVTEALEREFRPLLMTSTTGRSAPPIPFVYTAHDLDHLARTGRQLMEIGGSRREWRHLNLFPYAPHLAFWQTHYAGLGFGCFTVGTGGGKVMGTEGNIALVEKIRPEVLIGMPTFLYHVLTVAVEEKQHWPQLRKLVLGGEKVPPGLRRKLRALCETLGAPPVDVLATYGFTEAKMAWIECPTPEGAEPSGYHFAPSLALVEIIDPESGEPVGENAPGEIVFSALDSRGTVVLRYRTGDRISGGLCWEPCPHCERALPRLVGQISRVSEIRRLDVAKLKGALVDFNALEVALDDLDGLGAWQIELRKANDDPYDRDELILHAAPDASGCRDDLERAIGRRFTDVSEIRPNRVVWHTPEELRDRHGVGRALKEEKIVDHRPAATPDAAAETARQTAPTPDSTEKPLLVHN